MKKLFPIGLLVISVISLTFSFSSCEKDDDLSFSEETDSVLNILSERVERVMAVAGEVFINSNSPDEIDKYLNEIKNIEGVEDVYRDNHAFFVNVKGWGVIPYIYSDIDMNNDNASGQNLTKSNKSTRGVIDKIENSHFFSEAKSVCIINQQQGTDIVDIPLEDQFLGFVGSNVLESKGTSIDAMIVNFNYFDYHIRTFYGSEVTRDVYSDELFKYDLVFILTHGCYDWKGEKKHWLLTGEKYDVLKHGWLKTFIRSIWYNEDERKEINEEELEEALNLTKTQIRIAGVKEYHNGVESVGYFSIISEDYINNTQSQFSNSNAIVYNCACQSLKGNEELAKAFFNRGAACYLGWRDTDFRGSHGGKLFYANMLNGKSVSDAYDALPDIYSRTPRENGAFLDIVFNTNNKNSNSICITRPKRHDAEVSKISDSDFEVKLNGVMSLLDVDKIEENGFNYGFFTSTDQDMGIKNNYPGIADSNNRTFNFTSTLTVDNLKPQTTYYYVAYFFDGEHYCLSDTASFTTPEVSRIKHVVPDDILSLMSPHIPIYDGANPPIIENMYLISPMILSYNSNPSGTYKPGKIVADNYISFADQDLMTNTLNFFGKEVNSSGKVISEDSGLGAFITGDGDNFSVFFNVNGNSYYSDGDASFKEALIISGTKTPFGIKDIYYAFVMIEKNDPNNHLMGEGEFRVYVDDDSLSKVAGSFNTTRSIYESHVNCFTDCTEEGQPNTYNGIDLNIWEKNEKNP